MNPDLIHYLNQILNPYFRIVIDNGSLTLQFQDTTATLKSQWHTCGYVDNLRGINVIHYDDACPLEKYQQLQDLVIAIETGYRVTTSLEIR